MSSTTTPTTPPAATPKARRPRRYFMWMFLVIQALFTFWLLSALLAGTGASPAEIAQMCGHGAWSPLWKSYQDCAAHSGIVAAHDVGKGIALTMMVGVWVAVDVILGVGRLVVVFARRSR